MNPRFGRGLVVGKFCPLHRGHELLIEAAAAACEKVTLISYTKPEFPRCEPPVRREWLATRFPSITALVLDDAELERRCHARGIAPRAVPHNDDPDELHREFVGWLCSSILGIAIDAVFTSESYGEGFAAALTRHFRDEGHLAAVQHVCVDRARSAIPISATEIRSDPHRYRHFLSSSVYLRFVERVCLLGGESSGKTTLAAALARRFETNWVPEYGRELWNQKSGRLEESDMLEIAVIQVAREEEHAMSARRWLFCDTSPLTTLFYSTELFGRADPKLRACAERPYDHVFLCAPDFDFVQDGTRGDETFRLLQHDWYRRELERRAIPYVLLEGSLESRVERVAIELGAS